MESILIIFSLILVILFSIHKYLTWHFDIWNKIGLPGPKPKLLVGNFPSLLTGKQHLVYDFDDVYNKHKKIHRAIGVFVTRNPEIFLLDPKLAHEIMVTNFRKFRDNLASKWIVNVEADKIAVRNPFFTVGDEWKTRRADALAGLTINKLNLAYPIWKASARKLRNFLLEHTADGNSILETKNLSYRFTVNVMGDFLWGIDADTFSSSTKPNTIMKMSAEMLRQSFVAIVLYYQFNLVPVLKRFFNNRFFPEMTDQFFSKITKDALEMRAKDVQNAERVDYLNYLIQLQQKKQKLSHDDLVGHVITCMLDGYETAATVASHTLFYLAKYPEVQEKLRQEILLHPNFNGFLTFEDLTNLPYLEQCIHETIRLITPISIYSRICTESTELEIDGNKQVPIKLGTIVTIPIFSYHHDPDYFPEPYSYNPDRFDNGAAAEMTKQGIFMPFGDGPRICIGMRMGLFEVKTFIVEILKEYRVKNCYKTMKEKKPDANAFIMGLEGEFWLEYERL